MAHGNSAWEGNERIGFEEPTLSSTGEEECGVAVGTGDNSQVF
jgi:hypothetical protein